MARKLTKEQQQTLIRRIADVMMDDVLTGEDAVAILDILINACQREKEAIDPTGFIGEFL